MKSKAVYLVEQKLSSIQSLVELYKEKLYFNISIRILKKSSTVDECMVILLENDSVRALGMRRTWENDIFIYAFKRSLL